jgi:hypothetical protein
MKAVLITELDQLKEFPVGYILKSTEFKEMVGCCPKAFFNFFGLLGTIEELNSSFLFWLKAELQEDEETLLAPSQAITNFFKNPIFNKLDRGGGYIYDQTVSNLLNLMCEGYVMLVFLLPQGMAHPSHCEVYHCKEELLLCNGIEIDGETFNKKIFCHEKNQYILGRKKGEV